MDDLEDDHGGRLGPDVNPVSPKQMGSRRSIHYDEADRNVLGQTTSPTEKAGPGGLMQNPEDQKRVQRIVQDVADLRGQWDKLKTDFLSEREQIRDHVTSFESVVVNQVQTFSQHTTQVLSENKAEVRQEIENRRNEAADIMNVINTMKLSVDRESFERMEQQEQVAADIQATLARIEQVRKDFLSQISTQSANIDGILAALEILKSGLDQEQHERMVKYEQIDVTFEQFLGIKASLEAELKEHQRDSKELLSMMNAMSKKQDLDAYERIMHEEQVRNWFAETNEKVLSIRAEALSMTQGENVVEVRPDTTEGNAAPPSIPDELLRRRRPSKERIVQPRVIRDGSFELPEPGDSREPVEERRSSISYNPGLTGVTRQLAEERQVRQKAIDDLQSRCNEMLNTFNQEIERLEEQKRWGDSKELELRWREILAEERKQWKESIASAEPVVDIPQLELRWKEILAEERKQWSDSSAGTGTQVRRDELEMRWQVLLAEERKKWTETGDVKQLEGRISRLEAALEGKARFAGDEDDHDGFRLAMRMDALAAELRDALSAHNARLAELAAEGKLAKQQLDFEAKRAASAEGAASQITLELEKRLLGMQQRADHELQSLREAFGSLHQLIADNPRVQPMQLQQQAASVDEDRLLAVQQRFEEELEKRTGDLQRRLADIDSQLVGQRESEDQDGNERYAALQQLLETLVASIAAQSGQAPGQSDSDEALEKNSSCSVDEVEGLRRVSKNEFHSQTQSLWSAVKQLQQHVETQVEDPKEETSTAASTTTSLTDGRRALVAGIVTGTMRPASVRVSSTRASSSSRPSRSPSSRSVSGPSQPSPAYMIMSTPVARQRSSDSPSPFRQRPPANATALPVGASGVSSSSAYAQPWTQPTTPTGFVGTPRSASRVLNATSPVVSRSFSGQR